MNLRKDHCRNLPSRTTREPVLTSGACGTRARALPHVLRWASVVRFYVRPLPRCALTNPGANCAKEILTRELAPVAPDTVCVRDVWPSFIIYNDSRQRISRLSHR